MGMGDELMAAGAAERHFALTDRRVVIVDKTGRPRTHELWRGNPAIVVKPGPGVDQMQDGPSCRPYIDYQRTTPERWVFKPYRPIPATLYSLRSQRQYADYVFVEPNIKTKASPCKQWGFARWQTLIDSAPHIRWLQCSALNSTWLQGVTRLETPDFLTAVSILAGCRAAVLPEGGMHHAAAAVGTPAVVLFGAATLPTVTGYDSHTNLWIDDPEAAGWRLPHPACEAAWNQITPGLVLSELEKIL